MNSSARLYSAVTPGLIAQADRRESARCKITHIRGSGRFAQALGVMENILKMSYAFLALFAALPAVGSEHRTISQASELVPWCKAEAEAPYVARNITPYQWTASYHESGNIFYVEGKLRVHNQDVSVRCSVPRGAVEDYASIQIDDSTL